MKPKIEFFNSFKKNIDLISMLTIYDYSMAKAVDGKIDIILVGDSLGMVIYGQKNTQRVSMYKMINHTKAVSLGIEKSIIVADMPKGSYENPNKAIKNAQKLIKAGAHIVKIENYPEIAELLTKNQIPVIGHIGLTPQSITNFKYQGKTLESSNHIKLQSKKLESAGCCAIVMECIPSELAQEITNSVKIPTIGIGCGKFCDGQVLVSYDLLGIYPDFKPKFVKQYANLKITISQAVSEFDQEVKASVFPLN